MSHVKWSETKDGSEWDDFVVRNGGSLFHLWSWRKVLESDDSRPLYLACRDADGRILAVCPFVYRAWRRFQYLDSLPDSHMAGPVIEGRATDASEIIAPLPNSVRFAPFNRVVAMKIRAHEQQIVKPMIALGFRYSLNYGLFILDLHEKTPDHIWNNGFNKHDRQAVKYYEQRGSVFGFAAHERDYLDYLALPRGSTMNLFGLADFLSKMRLNLGDRLRVALVTLEDNLIAGLSILCNPGTSTVHLIIIRYSPVKNIHSHVTYLNWKAINWAHEQGFRYVDFGPWLNSKSSNPAHPWYKLRRRFEITMVPTYVFTPGPSGTVYSIARRINRLLRGAGDE